MFVCSHRWAVGLVVLFCLACAADPVHVWLSDLPPLSARQDWGALRIDLDVNGAPLRIGDRAYQHGLGTHARGELVYDLAGEYERFTAAVGVDASMIPYGKGSVEFIVYGDGRELCRSGGMKVTDAAREVDVAVRGVGELRLVTTDGGDGIECDHADWADAALTGGAAPVATPKPGRFGVRAPGISIRVTEDGEVAAVQAGRLAAALRAATRLSGCRQVGRAAVERLAGGGLRFTRRMAGKGDCTVEDTFRPGKDSLHWEIALTSPDPPWTMAVVTGLRFAGPVPPAMWAPWADPEGRSDGWRDPLVLRPFGNGVWPYGNGDGGGVPLVGNSLVMPMALAADPEQDAGLGVVLSPADPLLDLSLATSAAGGLTFTRTRYRLGGGKTLRLNLDLVPTAADWRGLLGWAAAHYPAYFDPANPAADDMAGCGAYSGNEDPIDVAKFKRMAFRTNWKLSDDFPYMGMFIPPVKSADEHWTRSCDEPRPPGKPDWTSCRRLNDYARWMRSQGFYVLDYFNVTEFGKNLRDKDVPATLAPDPEVWKDGVAYLKTRTPHGYLQPPVGTCYGAWVVDPGDPDYRAHILEQARRHIALLPDTSGICIDRLDWLRWYNPAGDDGLSWVDGKPARSLYRSWHLLMAELGPLMHRAGKVIFVNNHVKRLDLLAGMDGIYCEFAQYPAALNSTGLLCIRRPALGWTAWEGDLKPDPDAFFQRHLHLGVYPTAPYPNNNHCIGPSPFADEQYLAYGPLLDAMRGKK
ncbi:MAG: NPCBM/NEW2 domain-containing protein, partial [Armatimonadetes bacterium]|nr:NPCBM/NEW2 domain-containing protein [Armatimonadota bacterium]